MNLLRRIEWALSPYWRKRSLVAADRTRLGISTGIPLEDDLAQEPIVTWVDSNDEDPWVVTDSTISAYEGRRIFMNSQTFLRHLDRP